MCARHHTFISKYSGKPPVLMPRAYSIGVVYFQINIRHAKPALTSKDVAKLKKMVGTEPAALFLCMTFCLWSFMRGGGVECVVWYMCLHLSAVCFIHLGTGSSKARRGGDSGSDSRHRQSVPQVLFHSRLVDWVIERIEWVSNGAHCECTVRFVCAQNESRWKLSESIIWEPRLSAVLVSIIHSLQESTVHYNGRRYSAAFQKVRRTIRRPGASREIFWAPPPPKLKKHHLLFTYSV